MIELTEPRPPSEVREIAEKQAQRFIETGIQRSRPVLTDIPESAQLYLVYAVNPSELMKDGMIGDLDPVGWRMLLFSKDGKVIASSEVRASDGKLAPSGFVTRSSSLKQLVSYLSVVRHEPTLDGRYEPRFFEVPSLHLRAIWLHGARDMFVVAGATAPTLASEPEMVDIVNKVFRRMASSRNTGLYGS